MHVLGRTATIVLILGDISVLYACVWVTLFIRFFGDPDPFLISAHLTSFTFLFIPWFIVYALIGLYGTRSLVFRRKLPEILFVAQAVNVVSAALLFFLVPFFQIAPKTILALYLVVSTVGMYVWRVYMYPHVVQRKSVGAVIVADGTEASELASAVNNDAHYPLHVHAIMHPERVSITELQHTLELLITSGTVQVVVVDIEDHKLTGLLPYIESTALIEQRVAQVDIRELYEEVFESIPLALIDHRWVLANVLRTPHRVYDAIKRGIDIIAALALLVVAGILFPFIACAIKVEDKGVLFTKQKRVKRHGDVFMAYKFRTMAYTDDGAWIGENKSNYVTRVGHVLRKTHLDELPQAWNILRGDISLVGPRPDIIGLYENIATHTPLYAVRYAIPPGLTGWAQTTQVYENGESPQSLAETHQRLAYDLYYVKNRSILFDIKIMVRTFGTLATTVITKKESS